jgi:hypothetical protein
VIRERIGAAALRAYPREARQTRGPEMLSTLLDASGQSNLAFARESASLVLGGLRERATITAQSGTRRSIADSCCEAAVIWSRPRDARRLLWLVPIAVLAVLLPPVGRWESVGFLAILSLGGLVRLAYDPRLAIACGLVWATLALGARYDALSFEYSIRWTVIVAAPPILMIGTARLGFMRRAAAR